MRVLETERLNLRWLQLSDAPFILKLVNEPSWLQHIGDRGVRTLQDAERYLQEGPIEMYARLGFGLFLVELKSDSVPIGLCGLLKRESLPEVDLGFALLPAYWRKGYALESAVAVLEYGRTQFYLNRVLAITSQDNVTSGRLLENLDFTFVRLIRSEPDGEQLRLFSRSNQ